MAGVSFYFKIGFVITSFFTYLLCNLSKELVCLAESRLYFEQEFLLLNLGISITSTRESFAVVRAFYGVLSMSLN